MADTRSHYDDHLGPIYEWMAGPFESASAANGRLFDELDLRPGRSGIAVDLGSGHGLQSIPLAQRGFEVIAVDLCSELLARLEERRGDLSIRTLHADINDCWKEIPNAVDVVVCMGDTLTHLRTLEEVSDLVHRSAARLASSGLFIVTFRDYVSAPLEGDRRFIPVRADNDRILDCFLEYQYDHVRVHDLLHERSGSDWHFRVSSYDKLRIDPAWLLRELREAGLEVSLERTERGQVTLAARSGG